MMRLIKRLFVFTIIFALISVPAYAKMKQEAGISFNILPNHVLYPLDIFAEKMKLGIARQLPDKLHRLNDMTEERLAESIMLAEKGETELSINTLATCETYFGQMSNILSEISAEENGVDTERMQSAMERTKDNMETFKTLQSLLSEMESSEKNSLGEELPRFSDEDSAGFADGMYGFADIPSLVEHFFDSFIGEGFNMVSDIWDIFINTASEIETEFYSR